jgi:hypothetical protein
MMHTLHQVTYGRMAVSTLTQADVDDMPVGFFNLKLSKAVHMVKHGVALD